jgi:uncharacterized protein YukE
VSYHAEGNVNYNFDAALDAARACSDFAESLKQSLEARRHWAEVALQQWRGTCATEFADGMNNYSGEVAQMVVALEQLAQDCAESWTTAVEQQHMNMWAQRGQAAENNRAWYEKGWDDLFGDTTKLPPKPPSVDIPKPPAFEATCNPWDYS